MHILLITTSKNLQYLDKTKWLDAEFVNLRSSTKDKYGSRFVLLMALSLIVQFVGARNDCEINPVNIKMVLFGIISLAQKNFNLDMSSKFTFERMGR